MYTIKVAMLIISMLIDVNFQKITCLRKRKYQKKNLKASEKQAN